MLTGILLSAALAAGPANAGKAAPEKPPAAPAAPAAAAGSDVDPVDTVRAGVRQFLASYAARDVAGVVRLFDSNAPLFLGTDLGEACNDVPCLEQLLKDRFGVWETATMASPARVHVEVASSLATAWFDTELDAKSGISRRKTKLRFATTWRLYGTDWKLTQVLLAVPTKGQSGREILRQNELN
ncbi:MAG: nuclear transport factor 2 family protein [Deltaproteobacteria bacterium]|nr:nuclear transport factor 2 family protein [Deltaproteobacteria bacterium]